MSEVNLLTDKECEQIAELSKRPDLNMKGCGHNWRYCGLSLLERKEVQEDIDFLETTLRKWCPDLIAFSNFTSDTPNKIRVQVYYGDDKRFQGVHYLDLPHNRPETETK